MTTIENKERLSVVALFITIICFNDGADWVKFPLLALGIILLICSLYGYYRNEENLKKEKEFQ